MKLCRYFLPDFGPAIGLVENDRVLNLTAAEPELFASFSRLICSGSPRECVERALQRAHGQPGMPYETLHTAPHPAKPHLLAPVTEQEIWAAGVTYFRSREARMEESEGGGSFYDRVYHAQRPELFFKGSPERVAGPCAEVRIRADSRWNVPEPELALVINARSELVGYTVGNDMSSRDIEGENPLYLPQAKVYRGSCALGPVITLADSIADPRCLEINLIVRRRGEACFEGSTGIRQMKRAFGDLISYLFREQEFPHGVILLTGTGIVPPDNFTLDHGDLIEIRISEIGTLSNTVA